ncbi:hypothetical protein WA1_29775 [Scytonema hofmannii PCC 7110]|uniref:Uncharacterized protein n=1 Tax=Scytonema hofmannii PCC 7110 TaxID=128403 RepID=A0A139X617_9CYAN|nr:hypothetical protein [Scytonema hofmannii]KYC40134.1 hypothetical protein WA1_29775 [Scytonema hofmannii PCC 7110]
MLAQFQSKYPQGNLITELVQIYHGKYIVRASVQIDGTTRATGMAAAEILEDAEDKARTRALMVLGITDIPQGATVISPEPTKQVQPNVSSVTANGLNEAAPSVVLNSPSHTEAPAIPSTSVVSPPVAANETKQKAYSDRLTGANKLETNFETKTPDINDRFASTHKSETNFETKTPDIGDRFASTYKSETNFETKTPDIGEFIPTIDKQEIPFSKTQDSNGGFATTNKQEEQFDAALENFGIVSPDTTENNSFSGVPSNVTPFPSRSPNLQEDTTTQATTSKRKKKAEPVDHSDDIAKIGSEMQRLGWNTDQGRDYLVKTYSKRSRHLLTPEELKDFLKYLESQPTPIDPLAGF